MNKEVTRTEIDNKFKAFCKCRQVFSSKNCKLCDYSRVRFKTEDMLGDCKTQWIIDNYNISRKDNK